MNYYHQLPIFNKLAEHYFITKRMSLGLSQLWRSWVLKFVDLKEGDKVLDLMCGDGQLWPKISKAIGEKGELTGIDYSQVMLEHLPKEYQKQVKCIAFQESKTAANSQDVVLSTLGMKHLEAKEIGHLIGEVERVLKPGGRYALLEFKMPKNLILKALVQTQLRFFKTIAQVFCPDKKCSVIHLENFMEDFSKVNYTTFYSTKTLTTQIKSLFGGLILVVYGRKI